MGANTSLARQVYERLHRRILSLELKPYQPLSEAQIAEELGVSRTPVREALLRLSEHKLVDILPQRGTKVAPLRVDLLERSQFLREALELAILRRVCAMSDRSELVDALRREVRIQRVFQDTGGRDRFYQSDEEFHDLFAAFANLHFMRDEVRRSKIHMDRFRMLVISEVEDIGAVIDQHALIAEAVEAGDLAAAENHMLTHLRRVFAHVSSAVRLYPDMIEVGESTSSWIEGVPR